MGRRSAVEILRRWMALDRALSEPYSDGVNLSEFAQLYGVDEKTIQRDITAFKKLGHEAQPQRYEDSRRYFWKYIGTLPMFTANLRRK